MTSAGLITSSGPLMASCAMDPNLTFDVSDSGTPTPMTASEQLDLVINPAPAIVFSTTTVPPATATFGVGYTGMVSASGGAGALTYSAVGLPSWLSLNGSTGAIIGTPTAAGTFNFTVTAADNYGDLSKPQAYSIVVSYPPVNVAPVSGSLPIGYTGTAYPAQTLTASGGSGKSFTWTVTGLPADGLTYSANGATLTVNGTPTSAQTVSFTAKATDGAGNSSSVYSYTITVYNPLALPAANPSTLPSAATVNVAYSGTVAASGGSGNYSYAVSGLSDGLTSSTSGGIVTISGTPTATGTVTFNVTVTDTTTNSTAGPITYTVTVNNALTLPATNPSTLPSFAVVNVAYTGTVVASGGSGNYSWTVTGLSDGLTSSSSGGTLTISGTPTATGTVTLNITVKDTTTGKTAGPIQYTITAYNALALPAANPSTLPSLATVNVAYSGTIAASGGSGNYSYAVTGLSDGLTSSTSGGIVTISGTPTATGTVTFNVTVTDTITKLTAGPIAYTVTVNNALTLPATNPSTLPLFAVVNVAYTGTVVASGGSGNYSWTVTGLSDGLTSSSSGGTLTISGTPTATGTVTLNVTVKDTTTGKTAGPIQYTITAYNALALPAANPSTLPSAATVNVAYSGTVAASGGSGNYSYAVTGLSDGLTSSTSGGIVTISGTPTATGTVTFNVTVTDTMTKLTAGPIQYTIKAYNALALPATNPSTLPSFATVNVAYTGTVTATGGSGNYSYAVTGLSNGLTSSSSGGTLTVSGKPTATGAITFSVTVTDTTTKLTAGPIQYTITAYNQLVVSAISLPVGYPGTAYPATSFTATGGSGTYSKWTWVATSGTALPAGLSLVQATGAITGTPANTSTSSVISDLTVTVTDSAGNTASANFTLTIEAALALPASGALADATTNIAYTGSIVATGGSGSGYAFTVLVGGVSTPVPTTGAAGAVTVADGITVSNNGSSTLTIGGTPTKTQTVTLTVSVKDGASHSAGPGAYTIAVNPPSPLALPASGALAGATTNVAYTGSIVATGGSGSGYAFTVLVGGVSTPVPTTGAAGAVTVADGITVSNNGTSTLTIGGTPTLTEVVTLTVSVKDGAGDSAGPDSYTIAVNPPSPLALPASGSLGGATTNVAYNGAINASGGSGSGYAFTVNVGSVATAVPANGTQVVVADGIWVSNTGGNTLTIGGTPTLTEVVTLTVSVKDGAGDKAGPDSYTIAVNPPSPLTLPGNNPNPSSLPNATLNQGYAGYINASGGSGQGYSFTVNGVLVTNVNGTSVTLPNTYGLTATNTGGNTLSIGGTPTSAATVTLSVTVTDSADDKASQSYTLSIINPAAGYTVSGTVSYGGSQTGWIYLRLVNTGNNCGDCGSYLGTAISAPGAFTIHGVTPGTYTLQAYMDNLGFGAQNASNPTGSTSNVTVSNAAVVGVTVELGDPGAVTFNSAPVWDSSNGLGAFSGGAVISYDPIQNSNGIEIPASYLVEWSTSSNFNSGVAGSATFPATGGHSPWIITGLTNSDTYYFRAAGVVGSGASEIIGAWSSPAPSGGVLIGAPTGGTAVSGTVKFSGTATGPLYVGFYNQNTGQIYATEVGSEANPPKSPAAYSVNVPTGSNYYFFGILDQNNTGLINAPGEISNTNNGNGNSTSVSITGSTMTENLDLTPDSASGVAFLRTDHSEQITATGINNNYQIDLRVYGLLKLPVAVELVSASNQDVVIPTDVATAAFNGNDDEFDFWPSLNGAIPNVGDTYTLNVTYSDGSSNSTANTPANPLIVTVGAVLDAFASDMTPASQATGVSLTPNFSWTDPASASSYVYQFQLQDSNNNTIWRIPQQHSNSNGFPYTTTAITWDVDPTGSGDLPSVSQLNGSSTYWWSIQTTDTNGNEAEIQTEFETLEAPLTLPASGALGAGVVNQNYNGSIVASGGSGSGYSFTVVVGGVVTNVPSTNSQVQVANGIWVSNNGSSTLAIGGYVTATGTVTLTVAVTDSQNHSASGSYTITIGTAPVGFTVSGTVSYSGSQTGWIYLGLGNCTGCNSTYGTAIQSPGPFTIRGVPPGRYVVQAWMDTLGYGVPNAADPSTNPLPAVNLTVDNSALGGVSVQLADPPAVTLNSSPKWNGSEGMGTFTGGAFVTYDTVKNNNGVEVPSSYTLEYSTDSTFETGVASKNFPATGGSSPWIVTGLTTGDTYYFRAAGVVGSGGFATTGPWSSPTSGITIAAPSGSPVSGKITFSQKATGPLYVGFYNVNTGNIYATEVGSKTSPPTSPASYSLEVPIGSNYFFFAFLDQNNSGLFSGVGQISNVFGYNMITPSVTIAGGSNTENMTLPSGNSAATVMTGNGSYSDEWGSGQSYELDFNVIGVSKLPVAVALTSGANVVSPADIASCRGCGYETNSSFFLTSTNLTAAPTVGAAYGLKVTYSDGTSETLSPKVTAVLPNGPTDLSPVGTGASSTTPTLTWNYPDSNASNYLYQMWFADINFNTVWSIPSLHSPANGFTNSISPSITWGTDPTGVTNNTPTVSSLTGGEVYYWEIKASDANGNFASYFADYVPDYAALALPAANPNSLGSATMGQSYDGSITATGGYGGYSYAINGSNNCYGCTGISLGNGLTVINANGTLTIGGTPYATGQVVFTVYARDTSGAKTGPVQYTINVNNYANVSLPSASDNPLGSALVGTAYAGTINASGGPGGGNYAWTVNGVALTPNMPYVYTSVSNGDGLTVATSGGNTLWFAGTPTAVNSGVSIVVTVTDITNSSDTATATYTVPVVAGPNGANNKYLSGTYVCKFDGYNDIDGSRIATLSSIVADGKGGLSSGMFDSNSRRDTTAVSGTLSGTYNVGADNNGLMTTSYAMTSGGTATGTNQWAIALNDANLATTTASEFRMVEIDDVGTNATGQHGTGLCYQATTTGVFNTDVFTGNSFVFKMDGESGGGTPQATLGRFVASGGKITGGVIDQAKVTDTSVTNMTLSGGSYTIPDATNGRSTLTITATGGTATFEIYVIDANRMFMIGTGDAKAQSADVRKQIVTSYATETYSNSPFVTYEQGFGYSDSAYSYYSMVVQGTGSATGNGVATGTVGQIYQDNNNVYSAGQGIGSTSTTTFDSTNPGRATVAVSGSSDTMIAYYFNEGSAFQFDFNGSESYLATGWTEPQTQTTFTDAKVGGDYLLGSMAVMKEEKNAMVGELDLSTTSDAITGSSTQAGPGEFSWDSPISGLTYAWDTTAPNTGTFLLSGGTASCAVISSTKAVCTNQSDFPTIIILQQ
jgi:hypothetical protein